MDPTWPRRGLLPALLAGIVAGAVQPARAAADVRIDTYRSNYLSVSTADITRERQDSRLKLQTSIRSELVQVARVSFWMSYTLLAFWDIFDESRPFREYDHNPEGFFAWHRDLPHPLSEVRTGWMHQSNGEVEGPENRSWDRAFVEPVLVWGGLREKGMPFDELAVQPRFWWVFDDAEENRGIHDVANLSGRFGGNLVAILDQRPVARYVLEIGRSYRLVEFHMNTLPLTNNYSTFIQIFNGKGESLVDFSRDTTSLSVGIALLMEEE
jgi:phospholipase A1